MIGPDGMTWFIVGVSVASFMAFLLIVAIICCIVACCRRRKRVQDGERVSSADSSRRRDDETPHSGRGKNNEKSRQGRSYDPNNTRNVAEISVSVPFGHQSSANPNDLTMLTNQKDAPKQPVIRKYNKDEISGPSHQDLHGQNPFLPGNI